MIRFFGVCLVCGFLLSVRAGGSDEPPGSSGAQAGSRISVHLYNYAQAPASTLSKAKRVAAEIFRRVKVETFWHEVPLTAAEVETAAAASRRAPSAGRLALGILPRSMTVRLTVPRNWFGFARIPEPGKFPTTATVFFHQVEKLAWDWVVPESMILGHLMAHEVGHLLLAQKAHSHIGIMSFPWRRKHLGLAAKGQLVFTPEEALRIHTNIKSRLQLGRER